MLTKAGRRKSVPTPGDKGPRGSYENRAEKPFGRQLLLSEEKHSQLKTVFQTHLGGQISCSLTRNFSELLTG